MQQQEQRLLLGLATALLVGTSAWAAPQEGAELPAARAVIDKHIEVTKAKAIVEKTSYTHVKGKLSMPGMGESAMEVWSAKPDKNVVSMEIAGMGAFKMGYVDGVAWQDNPMAGAQVSTGAEKLQRKLSAAYDSALKPSSLFESMETVGKESFGGKDCYKVKLVAKAIEGMDAAKTEKIRTTFEFYDVETGLLAGNVSTSASQMGEMEVTSMVSDYKEFGPGMVATKTVQKSPMGEMVITLDSVEYPETMDSAVFALPASVKAKVDKEMEKAKSEG